MRDPAEQHPPTSPISSTGADAKRADAADADSDETSCPRCGESQQLAKVKGCIKCLQCGFKFDCNGW